MIEINIPGLCINDLVFLLDRSGSIEQANWDIMIDFTKTIIERTDIGPLETLISTVLFGNMAYIQWYLGDYQDKTDLLMAMDTVIYREENTNTTGGLWVTRNEVFKPLNGEREDIPDLIVLVTDGIPTRDVDMLPDEINKIREAGIRLVAIGIGEADEPYLASIAESEDYYVYLPDFASLSTVADRVMQIICGIFSPESTIPEEMTTPMITGRSYGFFQSTG